MEKYYYPQEIDRSIYLSILDVYGDSMEENIILKHIVPCDYVRKDYYDEPIYKKSYVAKAISRLDKHGKFIQPDLSRLKIEITYMKIVKSGKWFSELPETDTGMKIRKKDNAIIGTDSRRISSNNVRIKLLYKKPRGRIFREITPEQAFDLGYCIVWH